MQSYGASTVPLQLQDWLQQLYRLPAMPPVDAFLIEGRAVHGPTETLLLRETGDDLELGLYLDVHVLQRLEARGGLRNFAEQPLEDFWSVLEGVSHFVCLGWHAERNREISALDLEIQAEIDKFVTAWEFAKQGGLGNLASQLYDQLFSHWREAPNLGRGVAERYRVANRLAARYCAFLRDDRDNVHGLRAELREFFRLPPHRRRDRINAISPAVHHAV